MQLSAANLLVAAQQIARQVQQPNAKAFSAALASATGKEDPFAPLDFKQTASFPAAPQPQTATGSTSKPGANLDIRI